jgi:hypothetical protein
MTIPLTVGAGETAELANPNQGAYYFWDGKPTSAQYYINNKGVPENEACTWGTASKTAGNWAPLNFGTSFDDLKMNQGFSSLAPNNPTTNAKLDFTVTFSGNGVQNACRFNGTTGQYCMGPANDYSKCGDIGCTVSLVRTNVHPLADFMSRPRSNQVAHSHLPLPTNTYYRLPERHESTSYIFWLLRSLP